MAYQKKEQPGIMLYWSAFDALEEMVDGEAKQMLRAMRQYAQYGETPDFSNSPSMKMAWCFMKDHIDRDQKHYEDISERRSKSGKKGGENSGKVRRSKVEKNNQWGLG